LLKRHCTVGTNWIDVVRIKNSQAVRFHFGRKILSVFYKEIIVN